MTPDLAKFVNELTDDGNVVSAMMHLLALKQAAHRLRVATPAAPLPDLSADLTERCDRCENVVPVAECLVFCKVCAPSADLTALVEKLDAKIEKFAVWRRDFREHERLRACAGVAEDDLIELGAALRAAASGLTPREEHQPP